MTGAAQPQPVFWAAPGGVQRFAVSHGNDGVAIGNQQQRRGFNLAGHRQRVEGMAEQPPHRHIGVMPLGDASDAVIGRDQDDRLQVAIRGEVHGDAAAQATAHGDDAMAIDVVALGELIV